MNHANRVRELRLARRLSVTELARSAEVSRQTIYNIEGDEGHNVSTDTMRRIAAVLGATLAELYGVPSEAAAS